MQFPTKEVVVDWIKQSLSAVFQGQMNPLRQEHVLDGREWRFTFYPTNGHCKLSYRSPSDHAVGGSGYASLSALADASGVGSFSFESLYADHVS